ncbi:SDR family NAD(P)-dependent oxidoreductase [Ostreibacterium oceani]|uniref:SDR family NAD(P)-dependent oxidoreductase n=1 Tax=Ostreibacterium oceani TaxID=2654998 RepID=A0A6N7F030_9GAMM|nr:SDR family NAD(P)-dependent oxidoreductase [Ostreibacterium oceani]MPV86757.1 SDR family NAD(P)-dependent oxidoreductase [Ostreibacterium oceani]
MPNQPAYTWIIGASAGIGKALAQYYAQHDAEQGDCLVLSARNEAALIDLQQSLAGGPHHVVAFDVSCYDSVLQAKNTILSRQLDIHRVIFMAGVYQPMRLGELQHAQVAQIISVNLLGAFYVTEIVLPILLAQTDNRDNRDSNRSRPQLALCASVAGYRGLPNSQPYGATKAGVINLAESLRTEYGKQLDIRLINPGFVATQLTAKNDFHMPAQLTPEQAATAIAKGLAGRRFEIHFPKRFTYVVKLISRLPYWLYFALFTR